MQTQLEIAKHRLFDDDALKAQNVKLYPGSSRDTNSEQLSEQINMAIAQIETGDYEDISEED